MGGSKTTTTTQQQPPQMLPEGREGYIAGSDYYKGILGAPPIYTGQRVAGLTPDQQNAMQASREYFSGDQPYMSAAKGQIEHTASGKQDYLNPHFQEYTGTAPQYDYRPSEGINAKYDFSPYQGINSKYDYEGISGKGGGASAGGGFGGFAALPSKYDYTPETTQYGAYDANVESPDSKFDYKTGPQWSKMDDPEMQKQIAAASEPIISQLKEEVMPGIRSSGTIAGQGGTSTRGDVARQQAVEGFGRTVGSSVIAPLIMQQSQLSQDYTKAIQEMNRATREGDADRAGRASIAAESIQQQSHDVTNQINQQRAEADATNKGRYASDFMTQQNVGAGVGAQYADIGARTSVANMQDVTNRAIADAQSRLGYAGLDSSNINESNRNKLGYATLDVNRQEEDARNRLGYAGLDTGAKLSYNQLRQNAYDTERNRQLAAAGMAPEFDKAAAFRIAQINQAGTQEQIQRQREMDSAKQAWEEPIFRQSSAASQLMGVPVGPGGSSTTQESQGNWLSTIMQMASTAAAIYAASSETVKEDIVDVPNEEGVVDNVLHMKIKQWRYTWDDGGTQRMGPILEQSPDWLKASDKTINILSLVSALVLTAQSQNKRIVALEKKCSSK